MLRTLCARGLGLGARHGTAAARPMATSAVSVTNAGTDSGRTYDSTYEDVQIGKDEPSSRAFTYLTLGGSRFMYASLGRLAVMKFVSSMSASADVLALSALEVDISKIDPGTTMTVKWRGKPVFIRNRTDDEVQSAVGCDVGSLRDPESDDIRRKADNSQWCVFHDIPAKLLDTLLIFETLRPLVPHSSFVSPFYFPRLGCFPLIPLFSFFPQILTDNRHVPSTL